MFCYLVLILRVKRFPEKIFEIFQNHGIIYANLCRCIYGGEIRILLPFSKIHRKEYRKPLPIFKNKGGKTYGQCRSKIIL